MAENLTFHFEGSLADDHRMNFYEAARFQYAAARLVVKLAQFRQYGRFVQKITNNSSFDIQLVSQTDGSYNINVVDPGHSLAEESFISISLADLIAYVSERIVEKIDETTLKDVSLDSRVKLIGASEGEDDEPTAVLDRLIEAVLADRSLTSRLPIQVQDLVRRRVAEAYRERQLHSSQAAVARIDFARSQKLIAMAAPLVSEMATALRKSANTLEITALVGGQSQSVLFLDRGMAQDIEAAIVDDEITPILGDITQFNKDNGWGKSKIENGTKTLNFSIPYDILPTIRQRLIDSMKHDLVYLQTYFVRDRGDDVARLIAVGILPTPSL